MTVGIQCHLPPTSPTRYSHQAASCLELQRSAAAAVKEAQAGLGLTRWETFFVENPQTTKHRYVLFQNGISLWVHISTTGLGWHNVRANAKVSFFGCPRTIPWKYRTRFVSSLAATSISVLCGATHPVSEQQRRHHFDKGAHDIAP